MPRKGVNISLSSYDDIFQTDAGRADNQQERIQQISLDLLEPFKNHPFKVVDDEAMLRTTESHVRPVPRDLLELRRSGTGGNALGQQLYRNPAWTVQRSGTERLRHFRQHALQGPEISR